MRLKSIRLSGFKSFVDPTSFEIPSSLVGVVGPNGCGKSNIIDAVRWVLGESRASELRGESMQDVIFNGSDQRKQASRASVELVFDNTLGRVGGSWGTFAELAVKRILTRDGQSTYSINNQVVRRKDVHDMFMGTGLGPRAYAIIGQGTISRIIEARPEDLRIFLEEAAGVSKYKERRRETENRLQDTRENLTRIDDILRELTSQLEKLETQAQVAAQFREFEADRDRKQRMLWLIRRDDAIAERDRVQAQVAGAQTQLEEAIAQVRALETEIESVRENQFTANNALHDRQAGYYESNSAVARIEAEIRSVVDQREQVTSQLALFAEQSSQAQSRQSLARQELDTLADAITENSAKQEQVTAELEDAQAALEPLDVAVSSATELVDMSREEVAALSKNIEVAAARQSAARRQIENLTLKLERAKAQRKEVQVPDADELKRVVTQRDAAVQKEAASQLGMNSNESQWRGLEAKRTPAQESLRQHQTKVSQIEARIQALKVMQEQAQSQAKVVPWLQKHGLDKLTRLWQKIQIEPGWQVAVEAVLRDRVAAMEVVSLDMITKLASDVPPGKAAFYTAQETRDTATHLANEQPLGKQVRSGDNRLAAVMSDWLAHFYCATNLDDAVRRSKTAPAGTVFVTQQGHQVTRSGIQFYATENAQEGVLARQNELDSLAKELRAQQLLADEERSTVALLESSVAAALTAFTQLRNDHAEDLRYLGQVRVEAERLEQLAARASDSLSGLDTQISETQSELEALHEEEQTLAAQFENHDADLAGSQQSMEDKRDNLIQASGKLETARQRVRDLERRLQECSFETRSAISRREQMLETDKSSAQMLAQAATQVMALQTQLGLLNQSSSQAGLQAALEARVAAESALAQARNGVETANQQLRQA